MQWLTVVRRVVVPLAVAALGAIADQGLLHGEGAAWAHVAAQVLGLVASTPSGS